MQKPERTKVENCPICGKEEEHPLMLTPIERKKKLELERACGFAVSMPVYSTLCMSCREWVTALAAQMLLDEEKRSILKGEGNGNQES